VDEEGSLSPRYMAGLRNILAAISCVCVGGVSTEGSGVLKARRTRIPHDAMAVPTNATPTHLVKGTQLCTTRTLLRALSCAPHAPC
jgi:hypothetical protein